MKKFTLVCLGCGREHGDLRLSCGNGCNALLRTRYEEQRFQVAPQRGMFKFHRWLPVEQPVSTEVGSVVRPCERLGEALGLKRLYCAFGGYWPEIDAHNPSGTFKDLEAVPTLQGLREGGKKSLVVASAGNTARAFANAARSFDVDLFIVIPERMLQRLWISGGKAERIKVIALKDSADYARAIRLAAEICGVYGLTSEGGARSVARRDGLATVMLEAVHTLGRLPDHYFQAVGSGTGALAVVEAGLRVLGDEHFAGGELPRLHLSQNVPCTPIAEAWESGRPIDASCSSTVSADELFAGVLGNWSPPYEIRGGVADALGMCRGRVYRVANQDAAAAADLFEKTEGIDLDPAAAVALASLLEATARGNVAADELVLFNATGGGLRRLRRDFELSLLPPTLRMDEQSIGALEAFL